MANKEHLRILKQGVEAWNRWRGHDLKMEVDLSGANLAREELRDAYLHYADLRETNFRSAQLRGADLFSSNLTGANLSRANLTEANLWRAVLNGANLQQAHLRGAVLHETSVESTDVSAAYIGWTVFSDVDLRGFKGLEDVIHKGPSRIDIHTIYRSEGKIPEVFLRGAGTPDSFISYMKSLVGEAFEFYSCFISYSSKDEEFTRRLHGDLQNSGVRCWFAPEDVSGGKKLHEQIDEAIRLHDKLLLVLSEHSMSSEWVKTEIRKARQREEKESRQVLFPIRLVGMEAIQEWECFDADTGKDLAVEIREYFIPDFSNWKDHDSYKEAFDRLLRDLKSGEKTLA